LNLCEVYLPKRQRKRRPTDKRAKTALYTYIKSAEEQGKQNDNDGHTSKRNARTR